MENSEENIESKSEDTMDVEQELNVQQRTSYEKTKRPATATSSEDSLHSRRGKKVNKRKKLRTADYTSSKKDVEYSIPSTSKDDPYDMSRPFTLKKAQTQIQLRRSDRLKSKSQLAESSDEDS